MVVLLTSLSILGSILLRRFWVKLLRVEMKNKKKKVMKAIQSVWKVFGYITECSLKLFKMCLRSQKFIHHITCLNHVALFTFCLSPKSLSLCLKYAHFNHIFSNISTYTLWYSHIHRFQISECENSWLTNILFHTT